MKRKFDARLLELIRDFTTVFIPSERGGSMHTRRSYMNGLNEFLNYLTERNDIKLIEVTMPMISRESVSGFLDHLERSRGCSVSTRNQRLACIKSFLNYAAERDVTAAAIRAGLCSLHKKKTDGRVVGYMSEAAVSSFLREPGVGTGKALRDKTFLSLMYDTAARVSEVAGIRLKDLHLDECPKVVLHGKGGRDRIAPITASLSLLKRYLEKFHDGIPLSSERFLFFTKRRGIEDAVTTDNIRKMIIAYTAAARKVNPEIPERVHPHLFRHSRAMHLLRSGADLAIISELLGHKNYETTLIYAQADSEMMRKAMDNTCDPESPLKPMLGNRRYRLDDEDTIRRLYGLK